MRKLHIKILVGVIASALLLVMSIHQALALSVICNPPIVYAGTYVQGCKDNYNDGSFWKGRMQSISQASMAKLGWHSWVDQELCGTTVVASYDYGGSSGAGTNWASTSPWHAINPCGSSHMSWVIGNHYWEQSGYSETTYLWRLDHTLP